MGIDVLSTLAAVLTIGGVENKCWLFERNSDKVDWMMFSSQCHLSLYRGSPYVMITIPEKANPTDYGMYLGSLYSVFNWNCTIIA